MRFFLFLYQLVLLIVVARGFLHRKKPTNVTSGDNLVQANVKIYSNLAEIIQPLGKLPLEFPHDEWSNIRPDSITLVGTNVTVKQQTITEKKNSLKNAQVYIRSPSSSSTETKFIKATVVDEARNLVKFIDKDISKEPVYGTVSFDQIFHDLEPPQTKYYVNFSYDTSDAVYVSYLRGNLNWKTLYQLYLFDEPKTPRLTAMAEIRNDAQSSIDIEHAELLGGDINLSMYAQSSAYTQASSHQYYTMPAMSAKGPPGAFDSSGPAVKPAEEIAGLYVFPIDQPFSIDGKTSYLIPMFRPTVTVERFGLISKYFYGGAGNTNGKAQRSYRLKSDRFLSSGNCILRESDRLVGETSLPNLAANDKHVFSIGEDSDIVYKENITLVSKRTESPPPRSSIDSQTKTEAVYTVSVSFKNFTKGRAVKVQYEQQIPGRSLELTKPNALFTQDGSTVKAEVTLLGGDEKVLSYKFTVVT